MRGLIGLSVQFSRRTQYEARGQEQEQEQEHGDGGKARGHK